MAAVERNVRAFRASAEDDVASLDLPQITPAMIMCPDTDHRQDAMRQGFGHTHLRAFCNDRDRLPELGRDAVSPGAGRVEQGCG